jgi:hypothetical protein
MAMADPESDVPPIDEPDGNLHPRPWHDLLKRERREMLVDELLFTTGVTTLTAPSGEGKTTFAMSLALTVDTGGLWNGRLIKPRPVLWVAGEGQDDMRPMFEAWIKSHPNGREPQGRYLDEPIDLSSDVETDGLIRLLEGTPPALIVTDALADMIGDLDEDRSKDINKVYRNVWRVVRANNGAFLIPHHTGWEKDRERGSTAIRAKNDIVPHILKFDVAAGVVKLKHNKRRGGAKLKDFGYKVILVPVAGYPQPIPIVTGERVAAGVNLDEPAGLTEHAETALRILVTRFPHGASWTEFLAAWSIEQSTAGKAASKATFNRVLNELLVKGKAHKEGDGENATWFPGPSQSHEDETSQRANRSHTQAPYRGPETEETEKGRFHETGFETGETSLTEGGNEENSVASSADADVDLNDVVAAENAALGAELREKKSGNDPKP